MPVSAAARIHGRCQHRSAATRIVCGSASTSFRTARFRASGLRRHTGALELSPILKPLEPFRSQLNVISDLALPLAYTEDASAAANHSSSSAVFLSGARMHKNTNLLGDHGGPGGCPAHRPELAAAVARARYRGRVQLLRRRLELRLSRHDLLGRRAHAVADRAQSAGAVRAAVRHGRDPRGPREQSGRIAQHPRCRQRADRAAESRPADGRSASSGSIPHGCARDRAAHADREPHLGRRAAARQAVRNSRRFRRAPQDDVRSAGARLAGGDDTRVHAHAGSGGQQRRLSEERGAGRLSSAIPPLERPGEQGQAGADQSLPHRAVRLPARENATNAGRRRHLCSTTPS